MLLTVRASRGAVQIAPVPVRICTTKGIYIPNKPFLVRILTRMSAFRTTPLDEADRLRPKACGPLWGRHLHSMPGDVSIHSCVDGAGCNSTFPPAEVELVSTRPGVLEVCAKPPSKGQRGMGDHPCIARPDQAQRNSYGTCMYVCWGTISRRLRVLCGVATCP